MSEERGKHRYFDWIWQVRGRLGLRSGQSNADVFRRLEPLFQQAGTSYEIAGDRMTFRKRNQAAQDKMAVFDEGIMQIERGPGGAMLAYRATSRALLACFLAPLVFIAFAQVNVAIGRFEKSSAAVAPEKPEHKERAYALHPIDKALGAPEPEQKKKGEKKEAKDQHSPTPAYVFAAIFAVLYLAGRLLEAWLLKRLLAKSLADPVPAGASLNA